MATKDHEHIRSVLSTYGIGYSTKEPGSDQPTASALTADAKQQQSAGNGAIKPLLITDCVKFFPAADRSQAYNFGPHIVFIDAFGRPGFSEWRGGPTIPVVPGIRTACGSTVLTWGLPGDDGGHLTPTALGGSGKRANLVPQNLSLNRGIWRTDIEQSVANCGRIWPTIYRNTVTYLSPLDVRPFRFDVQMTVFYQNIVNLSIYGTGMPNQAPNDEMRAATGSFKLGSSIYCG